MNESLAWQQLRALWWLKQISDAPKPHGLGVFLLQPVSGFPGAGIFFLETISMNAAMAISVVMLGAALVEVRGQGKGDRGQEKQYPTADSSPAARNDKAKQAQAGKPVPQNMVGNRVRHTYVQTIQAPADKVFAVIEPVAELEWAPGFEYQWVYARDGAQAKAGQKGDVFLTQHYSGLGSQGTAIWVISRRDFNERRIQFVRVIPHFQVTQIDVHVTPDGKQSKCEITYTYTALSDRGREQLKHITREHYEAQMKEWEAQVNAYLSRR